MSWKHNDWKKKDDGYWKKDWEWGKDKKQKLWEPKEDDEKKRESDVVQWDVAIKFVVAVSQSEPTREEPSDAGGDDYLARLMARKHFAIQGPPKEHHNCGSWEELVEACLNFVVETGITWTDEHGNEGQPCYGCLDCDLNTQDANFGDAENRLWSHMSGKGHTEAKLPEKDRAKMVHCGLPFIEQEEAKVAAAHEIQLAKSGHPPPIQNRTLVVLRDYGDKEKFGTEPLEDVTYGKGRIGGKGGKKGEAKKEIQSWGNKGMQAKKDAQYLEKEKNKEQNQGQKWQGKGNSDRGAKWGRGNQGYDYDESMDFWHGDDDSEWGQSTNDWFNSLRGGPSSSSSSSSGYRINVSEDDRGWVWGSKGGKDKKGYGKSDKKGEKGGKKGGKTKGDWANIALRSDC